MEFLKFKANFSVWLVQQILLNRKRTVNTLDVNRILDASNSILYVVENELSKKKIMEGINDKRHEGFKDIFFIDIREIPSDIEEAWKYLSEKVV